MTADAILLHAGPCDNPQTLSEHASARLKRAVDLYRGGAAQIIVLAAGAAQELEFTGTITERGYNEQVGDLMIAYLLRRRVKPEHIRYDSRGKDAIGELFFSKISILEPENLRSLIIITNEFHEARSRALAAKILGQAYILQYETVHTEWDEEPYVSLQAVSEIASLALFREQFSDIETGNDEAFDKRLKEVHPLYKES